MSALADVEDLRQSARDDLSLRSKRSGADLLPRRTSFRESVVSLVCFIMLLVALALAGYVFCRKLEQGEHEPFDRPVWREPLDSWNL